MDLRDSSYGNRVGSLLIFNLIVGTGALALPKAFQTAGFVLSIVILIICCISSFICANFVVESMRISNAFHMRNALDADGHEFDEEKLYQITRRVELNEMATMFLGRIGYVLTYVVLTFYLFGDLTIYATTVPKSLMNIICSNQNGTLPSSCNENWPSFFNRINIYRIFVICFALVVSPLFYAGITKTKYLQLLTSLFRWTAFLLMISLSTIILLNGNNKASPDLINVAGFDSMFGTAVYAFMCQHSLPGLVTPMRDKRRITNNLTIIYVLILTFYLSLSLTAVFAFNNIYDVYTLNFLSPTTKSNFTSFIGCFLALFPVFTLTTNFPIIATTLSENLDILIDTFLLKTHIVPRLESETQSLLDPDAEIILIDVGQNASNHGAILSKWIKALVRIAVILLPVITALINDNVLLLTSLTGGYPGVFVQFVIPSLIVLRARKMDKRIHGSVVPKSLSCPFSSTIWPWLMFAWSTFALLVITYNLFSS